MLPYSWLYKSLSYRIFARVIPLVSLIIGCLFGASTVAVTMVIFEVLFVFALFLEVRKIIKE